MFHSCIFGPESIIARDLRQAFLQTLFISERRIKWDIFRPKAAMQLKASNIGKVRRLQTLQFGNGIFSGHPELYGSRENLCL
jgi:hypothetical protein